MLAQLLAIAALSGLTAGCGLAVPTISEPWDRDIPPDPHVLKDNTLPATGQIEFEIKKRIFCDLREAVRTAETINYEKGGSTKQEDILPSDWGAYISLSLEVDDSSVLQPGVSFINPLANMQLRSYGFGANLASTATRIDKFDSFYTVKTLRAPIRDISICNTKDPTTDPIIRAGYQPAQSSPFILESDLGIRDWLVGALYPTRGLPSDVPKGSGGAPAGAAGKGGGTKPDTVTLEEKFIITTSGNFTPSWKLTRLSANTGSSPLFSTGRVRTHDVIITIGPQGSDTAATNNVQQIGNAVSNGLQRAAPVLVP